MITDIDKFNFDRGKPTPNTHDILTPGSVSAKGTNSVNYLTPATNTSLVDPAKNGQLTIVQSGSFTTTTNINTTSPGTGAFGRENFNVYQIPHNLPFTPNITGTNFDGFSYSPMPWGKYDVNGANALWQSWFLLVDETNVTLQLRAMFYNGAWTFLPGFSFRWYLLQQTSN